jgi:S-adenosylmethionine decarboxylase proenzyme
MNGIHILGELYDCAASSQLVDAESLKRACIEAVKLSGLTIVGDHFHQFQPQGCTGAVILAESHVAIHTWPELGTVTVDIYVCNFSMDNTQKAQKLFKSIEKIFNPGRSNLQTINRGAVVGQAN